MSRGRAREDLVILLVEDNPDDEALTLRALTKAKVVNPVIVVRDGAVALDYVFGRGEFAGRDVADLPGVVLLDLKLPRVGGLEVLKRVREDGRTKLMPVVVLTSSDEESDILSAYELGANSYVRKAVDYARFNAAVQQLGLYWIRLNEPVSRRA
jgi:two-component system response regulator